MFTESGKVCQSANAGDLDSPPLEMPLIKNGKENRSEKCAAEEIQALHLKNWCVRRTYLCGKDRRSTKDYSHRVEWNRDRSQARWHNCQTSTHWERLEE